jgi:hypothetical protein
VLLLLSTGSLCELHPTATIAAAANKIARVICASFIISISFCVMIRGLHRPVHISSI